MAIRSAEMFRLFSQPAPCATEELVKSTEAV